MPPTTRQRILAAAAAVLHDAGSGAVTMRAVAERAGVTATALYRHFHDKDALLDGLRIEIRARFLDATARGADRPESGDRLLGALVAARTFAIEAPAFYTYLFLEPSRRVPRYPDDFSPPPTSMLELVALVEGCMDEGLLRHDSPMDVALLLAATLHGLLRLWLLGRFGDDRDTFEDFCDAAFVRLFAGLAPVPAAE